MENPSTKTFRCAVLSPKTCLVRESAGRVPGNEAAGLPTLLLRVVRGFAGYSVERQPTHRGKTLVRWTVIRAIHLALGCRWSLNRTRPKCSWEEKHKEYTDDRFIFSGWNYLQQMNLSTTSATRSRPNPVLYVPTGMSCRPLTFPVFPLNIPAIAVWDDGIQSGITMESCWPEVNPFIPKFKKYIIPVGIGGIVIFHLSNEWKAKFSILYGVIFLVRLQGKFDIDHSWEW